MEKNVVIKKLSVLVAASDQSFMPELIVVSTGRSSRALCELKEVRVAKDFTGEIVLLKNIKVFYPVIQINIKRCHSDGCDTRIHGIKTVGYSLSTDFCMMNVIILISTCEIPHNQFVTIDDEPAVE